jgi:hypothetical protein
MPAVIYEEDAADVAAMLRRLVELDPSAVPPDLAPDEVALIAEHRRKRIISGLMNKGIQIVARSTGTLPG